jgi:putative flippase GtrA
VKQLVQVQCGPKTNDRRPTTIRGATRVTRFSIVGALGIAVQLGMLEVLTRAGLDYLLGTVLAVEAAVLHNFLWHQRYTWRDRASAHRWDFLARMVRFHMTNGAMSLAGNALAMRLLVGELRLPVLPANFAAITACWLLNYLLSDRVVFTRCES